MSDLTQYNQQTSAHIIPFPGNKRIGKARHVAKLWRSRSINAREQYWQSTAKRFLDALVKRGVSNEDAEACLIDFKQVVQQEIYHLDHRDQNQRKI